MFGDNADQASSNDGNDVVCSQKRLMSTLKRQNRMKTYYTCKIRGLNKTNVLMVWVSLQI